MCLLLALSVQIPLKSTGQNCPPSMSILDPDSILDLFDLNRIT